jgi:hypothetical protein
LPEQRVVCGTQTPWQAPDTQAEFAHAAGLPNVPFAVHVCTPLPEHVT